MLTYCTNIHPGESWRDVRHNLDAHLLDVKARLGWPASFPLGLRISNRAAHEVDPSESDAFRDWCETHGSHVLTLNGFPYGDFAGTRVKEGVYLPDWSSPERARYTCRLADLLAEWLPVGLSGSISTVPIAFRSQLDRGDPGAWSAVRSQLGNVLQHLEQIRQERGRDIVLALEPEPGCWLETMEEVVELFARLELPEAHGDRLGICFDACHQAVEYEDPETCLRTLEAAGIRIAKVQVSSSLRAMGEEIEALRGFDEPTYLHQVVARLADGSLERFDDLPGFFRADRSAVVEARVHFHVPVFAERLEACGTTRSFLEALLPRLGPEIPLEVETYSWDVLPAAERMGSVVDAIVRELEWTRRCAGRGGDDALVAGPRGRVAAQGKEIRG